MTEPAWLADPTGRHQTRYWNGRDWTEHVADNGVAGVDSPAMPPPPAAPVSSFAAPTPQGAPSPQHTGSRGRWWIVAIPVVVIAATVAVVAVRDSNGSTSPGGAGAAPSGGGGGKSLRVEYTDRSGYAFVVTYKGKVKLQLDTRDFPPGSGVVYAGGGTMSVANANSGRTAPLPDIKLLAYAKVPVCDTVTKVSLPDSCWLEIRSRWSNDADAANGIGTDDRLRPGQTAVAAVDASWFISDSESIVDDTIDISGPLVWGIEVIDDTLLSSTPPVCVIRLVGSSPLLQELIDADAQLERGDQYRFNQSYRCDVAAA